jgi:hypothetical protein
MLIGINRHNLDPTGPYIGSDCTPMTGSWVLSMDPSAATASNAAMRQAESSRASVLACSWALAAAPFASSGMARGPVYATGSVTGPVVAAVQMHYHNTSARLLPSAQSAARVVHSQGLVSTTGHQGSHKQRYKLLQGKRIC